MPDPDTWLHRAQAVARLGTAIAAGQTPARIGYALLGLFVLAIGKHVLVPVLKELGACLAARIKARLMSPGQQRDRRRGRQ
jgi:hypothetical protein